VSNLLSILTKRREDPENYFHTIRQKVVDMASTLDVEIRTPRRCGRQGHRANYATDSCDAYYNMAVFNSLLDNVIVDLKERFSPSVLEVFNLPWILPCNIVSSSSDTADLEQKAKKIVDAFAYALPCDPEMAQIKLRAELELWQKKVERYSPFKSAGVFRRSFKTL